MTFLFPIRPHRSIVGVGLRNTGNICFLNCVLQGLASVRSFHIFLDTNPKSSLSRNLAETLKQISVAKEGHMDASSILHEKALSVQFRSRGEQQDAQEFYTALLDSLHSAFSRRTVSPASLFSAAQKQGGLDIDKHGRRSPGYTLYRRSTPSQDPFVGMLASSVTCKNCNSCNVSYSNFISLSLFIPAKRKVDLHDCLKDYVKAETIDDFMCDGCSTKTAINKRVLIGRAPKSLCLHLQRSVGTGKVSAHVKFPEHLELTPYLTKTDGSFFADDDISASSARRASAMPSSGSIKGGNSRHKMQQSPLRAASVSPGPPEDSAEYRLRAVVIHHGAGAQRGHFVTFRRAPKHSLSEDEYRQFVGGSGSEEEQWLLCNDDVCQKVGLDRVLRSRAYLLFYEKQELEIASQKHLIEVPVANLVSLGQDLTFSEDLLSRATLYSRETQRSVKDRE